MCICVNKHVLPICDIFIYQFYNYTCTHTHTHINKVYTHTHKVEGLLFLRLTHTQQFLVFNNVSKFTTLNQLFIMITNLIPLYLQFSLGVFFQIRNKSGHLMCR